MYLRISFLITCCCLLGCSAKPKEDKKFPITMAEVTVDDVPEYIKGIGELAASIEVDVRAQVSGTLTDVLFNDGAKVNVGDLLMVIDQRPFLANLKEAEASLAEDEAKLCYALDFANTYGTLVGKEYVARLDYQQGVQNVDVYKAAIEADIAVIEKAKIDLGYTEIRSPILGYIGGRTYDPGNYVDANQNTVLATLLKVTPLFVNFSIPSDYVYEVRQKQKINALYLEAVLPNDPEPLRGTLNFIDNNVNDQTGMISLRGIIPNADERGWPGQFVRVNLLRRIIENASLVPTSAIVLGQKGYFVFVVNADMTVNPRLIQKGFEYGEYTIVYSGLKQGEKVVTDGQLNLFSGAKVFESNIRAPSS